MSAHDLSWIYRRQVASRILAAVVGGYALTSAFTVLLALVWPLPRAQAIAASTMLGFIWYTVAVMWVFTTKSATRAWLGMLLPTALLALACAGLLARTAGVA